MNLTLSHSPPTRQGYRATVAEAREVMGRRLVDPDLKLDDIAAAIFVSRRHLQRCFAAAGTSFRADLARMRMILGRHLLLERAMTVTEVTHRVGYRQPAQFAKAFRRAFGVSPTEMRGRELTARTVPARGRGIQSSG